MVPLVRSGQFYHIQVWNNRLGLLQAVVDKSPVVASAVLVSAMHLLAGNAEIIKRWTNEIQEAVQSKSAMVAPGPALTDIQQMQSHTVTAAAAKSLCNNSELSARNHLHAARHNCPR